MVVLLGIFNALAGVVETVLRPGIGHLPTDVRSGALDLVLVRPVDAQFYVSFRRLDVWRLADVVLGLALAGYAFAQTGRAIGAWELIAFVVTFAVAIAVVYAIWVALMSLAFWFVAVENMAALFDAVFEAARYPVSAYPGCAPLPLRLSHSDRVDDDDSRIGADRPTSTPRSRSGRSQSASPRLARADCCGASRSSATRARADERATACAAFAICVMSIFVYPAGGANIASGQRRRLRLHSDQARPCRSSSPS